MESWLESERGSRTERSDALEETLSRKLQIAAIDLDLDEKPHIIFETLNARGEPLTQSDLVKNTVMYEADVIDDADAARGLWGMFEDLWWRKPTGESVVSRTQLDRFLHYWMVMKTRQLLAFPRVAAEFREYVGQEDVPRIEIVVDEMRRAGVIYKDIQELRDKRPRVRTFLKRMQALDVSAAMPVLLWLKTASVSDDEAERCFLIIESFMVRRMLYGQGAHSLANFFCRLIKAVIRGRPV